MGRTTYGNTMKTRTTFLLAILLLVSPACLRAAEFNAERLKATEAKVVALVARVMDATVGIGSSRSGASGSGVIVSQDGLILTAAHVTQATGDDLVIFFPNGKQVKAKSLGSNFNRDAGMAQITEAGEYPYVELGDVSQLELDQWCIALGHAGGFQSDRSPPIRLGRVLSPENFRGYLASDCTLIGGDSGGPLFDLDGKLIGIHSNIGASLTENHHVPISIFQHDWDRLRKGERWGRLGGPLPSNPNRPILGVKPIEETKSGIKVNVIAGASAEKAGLVDGDIIQSVAGQKTSNAAELIGVVAKQKAGKTVDVVVLRGDEEKTIAVELIRVKDVEPEAVTKAREKAEKDLDKLVDLAIRDKKRLELPPEIVENIGGMAELFKRLRKRFQGMKPEEIGRLMGERVGEDMFFQNLIEGYKPIVASASSSVVRLMRGKRQVALATAISADGYLLTKSSEVKGRDIKALLPGGERHEVQFEKDFPEYDLALIKIDARLEPVRWFVSNDKPALGMFVSAAGPDVTPLAVGVLSVAPRDLSGANKPLLGIGLAESDNGLVILGVMKGSSAEKAGLKKGDIVVSLNGAVYRTPRAFTEAILAKKPGDKVRLEYRRADKEMGIQVELGDRASLPKGDGLGAYPQGGKLSSNRDGYAQAIQTDLPIQPQECGSPVIDLDGRIIGINIARAGRIKSYAIPAAVIQDLLKDALPQE